MDETAAKAASIFRSALPSFLTVTKDMSKNSLMRLMRAMAEVPLNEEKFMFYEKEEMEAFQLFSAIQDAKFVLFQAALAIQATEQVKNSRANAKDAVMTTAAGIFKEDSNGNEQQRAAPEERAVD